MTKLQNHLKFYNIQLNDQLQYHSCMILIEIITSNLITSLYIIKAICYGYSIIKLLNDCNNELQLIKVKKKNTSRKFVNMVKPYLSKHSTKLQKLQHIPMFGWNQIPWDYDIRNQYCIHHRKIIIQENIFIYTSTVLYTRISQLTFGTFHIYKNNISHSF